METLCGLLGLLRLLVLSRFRLNGPYWRWREQTAFGRGVPDAAARRRAVLDYARWIHRMRRLARR